jgi:UDP-2-acetamido-2,6-beta-L-arabino-hexul-4-ose reductase
MLLKAKRIEREEFCEVPVVHTITLGEIVDLIYSFKKSREERSIPNMADEFTKKLYSTYLSYLPEDKFSYELKMNVDNRGSFTEFIKTPDRGQVSVNISKPGITKGNHWHHTKNEKFLVVSGKGVIRFRKIDSDEVIEYFVSGEKMEVVDIPTAIPTILKILAIQIWLLSCGLMNHLIQKNQIHTFWRFR